MVYMSMVLAKANEVFAPTASFVPNELASTLEGVDTIAEAADLLGIQSVVVQEWQEPLMQFLATIPPSIDAAAIAAAAPQVATRVQQSFR